MQGVDETQADKCINVICSPTHTRHMHTPRPLPQIFLDQLPEGLTARDIARVFSRLRRPVAAPPVLPSDAGAAGEGAAGEGEEGEGVIATASSDAAVPVAPPAMEGGKVDAVVLLQAGPGARRLFPHWRGRGIDPALAPRAGG